MRILLLIVQFPPDVNSTGLLMAKLCAGLRNQGHTISVLTTFPHYEKFRVWDEYRGKLAERDTYDGMDVLRLYVYASGNKQRMTQRLLSYLSFAAMATLAGVLSRRQYDVILCTNGSFFSGIAATVIGFFKGIPFVYNVQDLYPETPVMAGQLRSRHAIAALGKIEQFMYRRAAHVAVITRSFRDNIISKKIDADKISIIPNFVDTGFIKPLPKVNPFSEQHGLADKFVVAHAGNVGYVYDLEALLEAAALVRHEPDIRFLIVGDGVMRQQLEDKARRLGLSNVQFLPFQPHESLPWLRATCDVQVALYRRGSARYSMPSKVYEIMASGRPILASADVNSDVWRLVEDTGCGICVEPHDPEKLAASILRLYRDRSLGDAMGERGRQQAEQHYSWEVVVGLYDDLLQHVAARSRARAAGPRLKPSLSARRLKGGSS
jgi:colanic acid biosynthesis glycosyl transferase WcaI